MSNKKFLRELRKRMFLFLTMMFLFSAQAQELLLVDLEIPEGYQQLKPGDSLLAETQIILAGTNRTNVITDVFIEYTVKDKDDHVITKLSETKGGIVRIQTVKELFLPADLAPGTYSLEVKASYKEAVGQTSASFKVTQNLGEEMFSPSFFTTKNLLLLLLVGLIGFFLFTAYQFWKIGKLHRKRRKS